MPEKSRVLPGVCAVREKEAEARKAKTARNRGMLIRLF
jgi:hypothetical protein